MAVMTALALLRGEPAWGRAARNNLAILQTSYARWDGLNVGSASADAFLSICENASAEADPTKTPPLCASWLCDGLHRRLRNRWRRGRRGGRGFEHLVVLVLLQHDDGALHRVVALATQFLADQVPDLRPVGLDLGDAERLQFLDRVRREGRALADDRFLLLSLRHLAAGDPLFLDLLEVPPAGVVRIDVLVRRVPLREFRNNDRPLFLLLGLVQEIVQLVGPAGRVLKLLAALGRGEVDQPAHAGDGVELHAVIRQEEVVDHVLAGEGDLDRPVLRQVNRAAQRALPVVVLARLVGEVLAE